MRRRVGTALWGCVVLIRIYKRAISEGPEAIRLADTRGIFDNSTLLRRMQTHALINLGDFRSFADSCVQMPLLIHTITHDKCQAGVRRNLLDCQRLVTERAPRTTRKTRDLSIHRSFGALLLILTRATRSRDLTTAFPTPFIRVPRCIILIGRAPSPPRALRAAQQGGCRKNFVKTSRISALVKKTLESLRLHRVSGVEFVTEGAPFRDKVPGRQSTRPIVSR